VPERFVDELEEAFDLLSHMPGLGRRWRKTRVRGVRRLLLRTTRQHVYYVSDGDRVVVLAVWGAQRGAGPRL